MKKIKLFASVMSLALGLSACGGGGGGSDPSVPKQEVKTTNAPTAGLWEGTIGNGRSVAGIGLKSGDFYFLYTVENNPYYIAGMVSGTLESKAGSVTSTSATDFNLEFREVYPVYISASVKEKDSLSGYARYNSDGTISNTFSTKYNALYEEEASISKIAGTYYGNIAFYNIIDPITKLTINEDGSFSSRTLNGCYISGKFTPLQGENAYEVATTFGGSPCGNPNRKVNSVGFFDRRSGVLYAFNKVKDKQNAFVIIANKAPSSTSK